MKKDFIREKGFGNWYNNIDNTYSLIKSNDIDSHFSSVLLNDWFGCKVDLFYSFSTLYHKESVNMGDLRADKLIGMDIDLVNNKCFGNHVTYIENENCISLNRGIRFGCNDYFKKFAGSSLVTMMSVYDFDISDFTEEQLEVLICIDTAFKQYYFDSNLFKKYYNDILEYPVFTEIVSKHDKEYFYNIIKKYKLYADITVNDKGYLETEIELEKLSDLFKLDLSLPTERFVEFYNLQTVGRPLHEFKRLVDQNKIFSSAMTGRDYVMASVKF